MQYCNNCGVELEDTMHSCPLCGKAVTGTQSTNEFREDEMVEKPRMSRRQKTFVWEIISIILLSAVIATLLVNVIINKRVTWSEYPVAVCLTIFSYVSLFAFWPRRTLIQIAGSFITSSLFLLILDAFTDGTDWALKIAIPILLVANLIAAGLLKIIRISKYNGINIMAYILIGAALICISVEGILSFYHDSVLHLRWSMIVSLCVLLVSIVMLFMHFRLKKGRELEKTFHI